MKIDKRRMQSTAERAEDDATAQRHIAAAYARLAPFMQRLYDEPMAVWVHVAYQQYLTTGDSDWLRILRGVYKEAGVTLPPWLEKRARDINAGPDHSALAFRIDAPVWFRSPVAKTIRDVKLGLAVTRLARKRPDLPLGDVFEKAARVFLPLRGGGKTFSKLTPKRAYHFVNPGRSKRKRVRTR